MTRGWRPPRARLSLEAFQVGGDSLQSEEKCRAGGCKALPAQISGRLVESVRQELYMEGSGPYHELVWPSCRWNDLYTMICNSMRREVGFVGSHMWAHMSAISRHDYDEWGSLRIYRVLAGESEATLCWEVRMKHLQIFFFNSLFWLERLILVHQYYIQSTLQTERITCQPYFLTIKMFSNLQWLSIQSGEYK